MLTEENYFSKENELKYVGSSQFKNFLECEARALAEIKGEWERKQSPSMAESSYIDAYFSGTLDDSFKEKHPEMFTQKGELYAKHSHLLDVIKQTENDEMFMKYISGEHQLILTGEIEGVPVKVKPDTLFRTKCIVDMKAIKDFDLIWNEKKRCKENFIDYYMYNIQGAIYREVVRQNFGLNLPFVIAAMTKEKYSERALLNIPKPILDESLDFVKSHIGRIDLLKKGIENPTYCGRCDYCKSLAKVNKVLNYKDYFDMRGGW